MTIRKGQEWGTDVPVPSDLVIARSDRELGALVASDPDRPLAVGHGDLHRTLGAPVLGRTGSGAGRTRARRVDMDLLRVELDDAVTVAVAHVIARRPGALGWWRGPVIGVFNVEHLHRWDPAPGGHPNDGRAEVIEVSASMELRARFQAWRRLPSGSHLPHPAISLSRRSEMSWTFERPLTAYIDGERHGSTRTMRVTVEADAYHLYL
jgi:hypothetical protein